MSKGKTEIFLSRKVTKVMEAKSKFCLTWKDYTSNFNKEFDEYRRHEDFFDVSVAVEDEDHVLSAHKIVLSAASDFFKNILRKHKHENPLIYLTEVKFSDLQSILDFIYTGETKVAEKDLKSLLAVATRFKVRGFLEGLGDSGYEIVNDVKRKTKTEIPFEEKLTKLSPIATLKTPVNTDSISVLKTEYHSDDKNNLPKAVRSIADPIDISSFLSPEEQQQFETEAAVEAVGTLPKTVPNVIDTASVSQDYLNNKAELDRQCNELMVSSYDSSIGKTIWQCAQCHYSSKLKYTVKEHVETHISGFSHQCPLCDKVCNTRNALRVHTIRKHKVKKPQHGFI